MSEAPKKIWVSSLQAQITQDQDREYQIPYIRADLVDRLVKALEAVRHSAEQASMPGYDRYREMRLIINTAEAALAKLEEE
jgi:hypothetical protein